ncbi:MAG TPA: hypothetical protein VMK05_06050 [Burkholderiales bacterium]|nr:hypothetical protein [Burkholderiales bacterium]
MSARAWVAILSLLLPFALSACGEKAQVTVYKQGKYQGKPDGRPWDNERFKGDKVAWENAIKDRNQRQSEYSRE